MTTLSDLEDLLIENEQGTQPDFAFNEWQPSERVYAEELITMQGI